VSEVSKCRFGEIQASSLTFYLHPRLGRKKKQSYNVCGEEAKIKSKKSGKINFKVKFY